LLSKGNLVELVVSDVRLSVLGVRGMGESGLGSAQPLLGGALEPGLLLREPVAGGQQDLAIPPITPLTFATLLALTPITAKCKLPMLMQS
jgi:hypothetical protein